MVNSRDIERTISMLEKMIDRLRMWGFPAATVYGTKEGALKIYGTPAISEVIQEHCQEIFSNPDYMKTYVDEDLDGTNRVVLPLIDPPLSQLNFQRCRTLATNVVKAAVAGSRRKIGWGIPDKKPQWWPAGVIWSKTSLQKGVNREQLVTIIKACYAHFGQPVDAEDTVEYFEETPDSSSVQQAFTITTEPSAHNTEHLGQVTTINEQDINMIKWNPHSPTKAVRSNTISTLQTPHLEPVVMEEKDGADEPQEASNFQLVDESNVCAAETLTSCTEGDTFVNLQDLNLQDFAPSLAQVVREVSGPEASELAQVVVVIKPMAAPKKQLAAPAARAAPALLHRNKLATTLTYSTPGKRPAKTTEQKSISPKRSRQSVKQPPSKASQSNLHNYMKSQRRQCVSRSKKY